MTSINMITENRQSWNTDMAEIRFNFDDQTHDALGVLSLRAQK